jgi:hypothetical protein
MINETVLRDILIALAEHEKANSLLISSLLSEVAALRNSVEELGPTKGQILSRHRPTEIDPTTPALIQACDEIIRRLTCGEVC